MSYIYDGSMPPPKSEDDILASASFADRQLEYGTLISLQMKVIMSFLAGWNIFAILQTGTERAFAMLFSAPF